MNLLEKEISESREFLSILKQNIRWIILFVFISCLLTFIVTLLTPKKYRSVAVVFPTESNSIDDVIRNPQFGYDIEADRLVQLLQSKNIRDSIMKKYDLANYYKIDNSEPDWYDRFRKKYDRDVSFSKSVFMSVSISVTTKSPELSSDIANSIVTLLNWERNKLLKQNLVIAVSSLQSEFYTLKNDLDSIYIVIGTMTKNRKDVEQFLQADRYISLIFDKDQLDAGGKAQGLQLLINQYNIRLSWFFDVQTRLKNAKLLYDRPLPSVYVVENASPSYRKVSPRLSTNLVLAFFGSFLLIAALLFIRSMIRPSGQELSK